MAGGHQVILDAKGLQNNNNEFTVPNGALSVADNVFVNKVNEIWQRPGFENHSNGLPTAKPEQLFTHGGYIYCHINNQLYYDDGSNNWQLVRGVTPTFFNPFGVWGNGTHLYVADSFNHTIRRIEFSTGIVTTFAGTAGVPGSANGIGAAARFDTPSAIWGDATNLYVSDTVNHTIRKIVIATANVTTFAGTAGMSGSADGIGAAARFTGPEGIWGNATDLYLCDRGNHTIRKIVIATANVTTFAGTAGVPGSADGIGAAARFANPFGIWGNAADLYVCDTVNHTIRKIVIATANVTTFAGTAGMSGSADGIGAAARFLLPVGIWGNATDLYVCDTDNRTIRKIVIATANVTTFAGVAGMDGTADGVGSAARFGFPVGVWGDATDLYVSDTLKHTIRKIVITTANVTTFSGTAGVPGSADGVPLVTIFAPPG